MRPRPSVRTAARCRLAPEIYTRDEPSRSCRHIHSGAKPRKEGGVAVRRVAIFQKNIIKGGLRLEVKRHTGAVTSQNRAVKCSPAKPQLL